MSLPSYAMNVASFPEMYERCLVGPLFRPWAEALLEDVDLSPGSRLLDIACGTGIVARLAGQRLGEGGLVVGVDISAAMLAVARGAAPKIEWREGRADALPLAEGEQFDVVVCQQGLQFFPDKTAAAREMRRALAPGGKLRVAVWRADDEMPLLRDLRRVAERHLGEITDTRYGFGDSAALKALLSDAGLRDINVKTATRTVRFAPDQPFVRLNAMAFVGMSDAAKTMDEKERARVVDAITSDSGSAVSPYNDADGLAFEMKTNIATANR